MLVLYRRHKKSCRHRGEGRKYRRCGCPVWVAGTLGGRKIKESLKTRNWEAAAQLVLKWEADAKITESAAVSLAEAWKNFLADLEARKLSRHTIRKYKLLERQMTAFAQARGLDLAHFDLATLTTFRASWRDSLRTGVKKLERLRAFFRFAHERKWVEENFTAKIKSPKITLATTMPLLREELVKILVACDALKITPVNKARLKTLILLMRYSGLRISDAVALTTDQLDGAKLFLYTAKTRVPVYTLLPDFVLRALEATPRVTETRFFWSGQGKREHVVCDWQGKIKDAFDAAGIVKGLSNAVSHRLRDTFAVELLLAGVPLERVAVLLGHQSVKITEKHYSPWVEARQAQLEADLAAAWRREPALVDLTEKFSPGDTKGTYQVHESKGRPN